MKKEYPDKSLEEAKKLKAFASAHQTGLGIDFYIPSSEEGDLDIAPSQPKNSKYGSQNREKQRNTKAYRWLSKNAHLYGFNPYNYEPWHWEVLLPIEAWKTGAEVTDQFDIRRFDIRVKETSIATGTVTSNKDFRFE
jgi:hypothetical protein